jgi:hypothetical protein
VSLRNIKRNWFAHLSLAAITLLITGCQDYAARRDTIAFHAGEAGAYNRAVHTIDPWPAAAARTDMDLDGTRAVAIIERYETGTPVAAAPTSMNVTLPIAPGGGGR